MLWSKQGLNMLQNINEIIFPVFLVIMNPAIIRLIAYLFRFVFCFQSIEK